VRKRRKTHPLATSKFAKATQDYLSALSPRHPAAQKVPTSCPSVHPNQFFHSFTLRMGHPYQDLSSGPRRPALIFLIVWRNLLTATSAPAIILPAICKSEKRISFTRAASMNRRGGKRQFLRSILRPALICFAGASRASEETEDLWVMGHIAPITPPERFT
jgi:hypothetical protein